MRILPNSFKFTTTTLIKILVVLLISKGAYSKILGALFDNSSATDHKLEVYDTVKRGDEPCTHCALWCLWRRINAVKSCHAYTCDPQDRTCDFYMTSRTQVSLSLPAGVQIFLLQWKDIFHTVFVGGKLFSIYVSSTKMVYYDALTYCESLGGYLIEFNSLDEIEAARIVGGGEKMSLLIGANDLTKEGTWVYPRDGLPINKTLLSWGKGAPSNSRGAEHCAEFGFISGALNDLPCYYHIYGRNVLCERDIL